MLGPVLRGEKVSLEPARPEDAPIRCRWFADLELSRFWTGPDVPSIKQEEESFERWARDQSGVTWRIVQSCRRSFIARQPSARRAAASWPRCSPDRSSTQLA